MAKGLSTDVYRMFIIQSVYVFLFAFIMQSPTVYELTNSFMPIEMYADNHPTDAGLAIHAAVYVLIVFVFTNSLDMAMPGAKKNA